MTYGGSGSNVIPRRARSVLAGLRPYILLWVQAGGGVIWVREGNFSWAAEVPSMKDRNTVRSPQSRSQGCRVGGRV